MESATTSEYLKWIPSISAGVLFAVIAICTIVVIALAAEGKLCCSNCGKSVETMCGGSKTDHMKGNILGRMRREHMMNENYNSVTRGRSNRRGRSRSQNKLDVQKMLERNEKNDAHLAI